MKEIIRKMEGFELNPAVINSKLIINADDYGDCSNINRAIAKCFENNIINSTTMLVNRDGFEEAIELADKYNYKNKIGVHLNLTLGKSLTDLSQTGLTDKNGMFIEKSISNPLIFFSSEKKMKIKNEIQQQYNKLLENNITPTHLDSHHHVHTLPWVSEIFIEFAKNENQKIRITNTRIRKELLRLVLNKILNNKYKKNHLNFSDKFERVHSFIKYYNKLKDSHLVYEVMVHPVFDGDIVVDGIEHTNLEESLNNLKQCFL